MLRLIENIKSMDKVNYTQNQDISNSLTHLLGLPITLIIFFYSFTIHKNGMISTPIYIGMLIFSITAFIVYGISFLYHYIDYESKLKAIFRLIDHCTIYLLIAGTYTPICIFLIEQNHNIGYVILLLEWALAILGIILNALYLSKKIVKIIGVISYVIMGWLILFTGGFIYMPLISFYLVLAGGISYTIGSVLYALGRKTNLWFHTIFHCFIVIGTIIQALGIIMMIS